MDFLTDAFLGSGFAVAEQTPAAAVPPDGQVLRFNFAVPAAPGGTQYRLQRRFTDLLQVHWRLQQLWFDSRLAVACRLLLLRQQLGASSRMLQYAL